MNAAANTVRATPPRTRPAAPVAPEAALLAGASLLGALRLMGDGAGSNLDVAVRL